MLTCGCGAARRTLQRELEVRSQGRRRGRSVSSLFCFAFATRCPMSGTEVASWLYLAAYKMSGTEAASRLYLAVRLLQDIRYGGSV
eukprot:2356194-Rhodomonas_salina.2